MTPPYSYFTPTLVSVFFNLPQKNAGLFFTQDLSENIKICLTAKVAEDAEGTALHILYGFLILWYYRIFRYNVVMKG